jgi:hypothetical protein
MTCSPDGNVIVTVVFPVVEIRHVNSACSTGIHQFSANSKDSAVSTGDISLVMRWHLIQPPAPEFERLVEVGFKPNTDSEKSL